MVASPRQVHPPPGDHHLLHRGPHPDPGGGQLRHDGFTFLCAGFDDQQVRDLQAGQKALVQYAEAMATSIKPAPRR
jgi:hypothetical protein